MNRIIGDETKAETVMHQGGELQTGGGALTLVERYLKEAKFWLPQAQRADILAELSEGIRSQIEERETELGRTL